MPESFEYANNGGRKYLFHNLGGGKFEEVADKSASNRTAGRSPPSPPIFAARAIPTSSSPTTTAYPELFFNEGGKHFREVGKETRTSATRPKAV